MRVCSSVTPSVMPMMSRLMIHGLKSGGTNHGDCEKRGAEGVGCGEWMSPPHISPLCGAPSPENLSIFELKRASFGVLWVLFFAVD